MKKMYFIAVYPPQSIIDEIRIFKEDLALQFSNSKALKNEAHITLLPPFERELNLENDIHAAFQKINTQFSPFEITLNGFGSFPNPKNPVIYVKPEENEDLSILHLKVKEKFNFQMHSFNPHITVGYRDLTWDNYVKAWEMYKNRPYKTNFLVEKINLLRHDGKWVSIAEKQLLKDR